MTPYVAFTLPLFAAGMVFRDGWPATGQTQVARAGGALLCGGGVWCFAGDWRLSLIAAALILAGFLTDTNHAKGQQARTWSDVLYLAESGITSLAPAILACAIAWGPLAAWPLLGCAWLKPPIWFACWRLFPTTGWCQPTRMAALIFGACMGVAAAMAWRIAHP